jgi:hypothetical protein
MRVARPQCIRWIAGNLPVNSRKTFSLYRVPPNNSFKPKPHRAGLIQVLGLMSYRVNWKRVAGWSLTAALATYMVASAAMDRTTRFEKATICLATVSALTLAVLFHFRNRALVAFDCSLSPNRATRKHRCRHIFFSPTSSRMA